MLDARQAGLGRLLAERPQPWALEARGVPPVEAGALREDWERRIGIVAAYREAAGITDPAQILGPVPSGIPQLREAFHASVVALELPDDQALLRAQGRGELEATVAAHDRAAAVAPRDVQPEIGEREREWQDAQARAHAARYAMDAEAAEEAEARASDAAGDLARLAVADAARREWAEAHAGQAEAAREAAAELRRRGAEPGRESGPETETETEFLGRLDRIVNGTEAEPEVTREAAAGQQVEAREAAAELRRRGAEPGRESGPETETEFLQRLGRIVAGTEARQEAEAHAGREAQPQAETGEPAPAPERTRFLEGMAEIRATVDAIDANVERMPDRDAERRAEVDEAGIDEPVIHERQAEPELEPAWQPGTDDGQHEAAADVEAEIEM